MGEDQTPGGQPPEPEKVKQEPTEYVVLREYKDVDLGVGSWPVKVTVWTRVGGVVRAHGASAAVGQCDEGEEGVRYKAIPVRSWKTYEPGEESRPRRVVREVPG